jgi:hypothetical protein
MCVAGEGKGSFFVKLKQEQRAGREELRETHRQASHLQRKVSAIIAATAVVS